MNAAMPCPLVAGRFARLAVFFFALPCLPAQQRTGAPAAPPRLDVHGTAAWLAARASAQPDGERTVANAAWTLLALLETGSTMRVGPHKETVKQLAKWLRDVQGEAGRFAPSGVACSRAEQIVASLAMQRAFVRSTYKLLKPVAAKAMHAAEAAAVDAGADTVWSPEEAALLALLAQEVVAGQEVLGAALRERARGALAGRRFGRSRRFDAALHTAHVLLGDAHPPDLTVACTWPADLAADPLHTLFGVLAVQRTDEKTWAAQTALLGGLLAARAPGGTAWPATPGLDAATSTAILAFAVAVANGPVAGEPAPSTK